MAGPSLQSRPRPSEVTWGIRLLLSLTQIPRFSAAC
jgi:hypothetical protein